MDSFRDFPFISKKSYLSFFLSSSHVGQNFKLSVFSLIVMTKIRRILRVWSSKGIVNLVFLFFSHIVSNAEFFRVFKADFTLIKQIFIHFERQVALLLGISLAVCSV
jgi:hypothetical protein